MMTCPKCMGNGTEWLWARTNDDAKLILESNKGRIALISMDHDLGGHELPLDDPSTFYFRGSVEDDGKRLAEWMVETDNIPPNIEIHSWSPTGVQRILSVFQQADKYGRLSNHHTITIQRAQDPTC